MQQVNRKIIILLFCFAIPALSAEPESGGTGIAWPLEHNYGISSTFGEYRTNRLHAGIDLKTNGQNGLKVFAADDGVIFRIHVDRSGYGRALYIRHKDNSVSVYGHLQEFEDKTTGLESIVKSYRTKRNRWYPGDIYPEEPIPVSKGQHIAYSGETGAGLPHLHFEIRKNESEPYNPLLIAPLFSQDLKPPVITKITLSPTGRGSYINGRMDSIELKTNGNSVPSVCASGPLALTVEAKDDPGAGNTCGVDSLKLEGNGELLTSLIFDSFSYDNHREGGIIFDISSSNLSPSVFTYRMTGLLGTTVPVIKKAVPYLNIRDGINNFTVTASDGKGNEKAFPFRVYGASPGAFLLHGMSSNGDGSYTAECSFMFSPELASLLTAEFEFSSDGGANFYPAKTISTTGSAENAFYTIRPAGTKSPTHLRARANIDGNPLPWQLKSLTESEAVPITADLSTGIHSDFILLTSTVSALAGQYITVTGNDGKDIPMYYAGNKRYQAIIPADIALSFGEISLKNEDGLLSEHRFSIYLAEPSSELGISAGPFRLDIPEHSAFSPSLISVKTEPSANRNSSLFYQVSDAFIVEPAGACFKRPFTCRIDAGDSTEKKKTGIYRRNAFGKSWYYCGSNADSLSTDSYYTASFALFVDKAPPTITSVHPSNGSVVNSRSPEIRMNVKDTGSGIDYASIICTINGTKHFADYDPDRAKIFVPLENPFTPGRYEASISFQDYAGNPASKIWNFTVQ